MGKVPNGFITTGVPGCWLNIDVIDQDKSYFDPRFDKVAVIDKFGNRFNVERELVEGKIKWRE